MAISNNFAFGGANASLVLNRPGALSPPAPDVDDVVITGMSALTAAGGDVEAAWAAVQAGRDVHELRDGHRVGEVDLQPDAYLSRRERRRMDRLSVLSVVSAAQALADAGIEARSETAAGCGILFGTGAGPVEAIERFAGSVLAHGADAADPGVFPNTVYNQAAGQVAMHLGLRGPTSTLSVGHATAAAVVVYAADLLRAGRADRLVVTVSDALTDELVSAYAACGMVSARTDAAAPDGRFGLTEASVSLVLERRRAARCPRRHGARAGRRCRIRIRRPARRRLGSAWQRCRACDAPRAVRGRDRPPRRRQRLARRSRPDQRRRARGGGGDAAVRHCAAGATPARPQA